MNKSGVQVSFPAALRIKGSSLNAKYPGQKEQIVGKRTVLNPYQMDEY